ncbi:MAG: DUF4350 domain-containing protein [Actinobacteria bacterium]|nr:DUF4350 domain-containing protein [Actinomycetota bacterium]MBO0834063.1 DUF4350 domain-containing protein [Actinomycetota bacterium]
MTADTLEAAGVRPRQAPSQGERRGSWRAWLVAAIIVAAGVALMVPLIAQQPAPQYLSPNSVGPTGTHALADVLAGLGRKVQAETSVRAAREAATAGTTLVITSPADLSSADLRALAQVPASLLLVEPDPDALNTLAPGVELAGPPQPVLVTQPHCTMGAAVLAGTVDAGGENMVVFSPAATTQQCYPSASGPTLVQMPVRGRLVTVLGAGDLLTNADLGRQGNAALAINLLPTRRIVWLVPPQGTAAAVVPSSRTSFWRLVPLAAYLVFAQLAFALLLAVGWRSRRLGPLIAERLPVVVHAAETVIGHGQLYQSRHARDRSSDVLRTALLTRICLAVGLPSGSSADSVVAAMAQRSAISEERIRDLLYGPAPRTDGALAALARNLDDLAREVGVS